MRRRNKTVDMSEIGEAGKKMAKIVPPEVRIDRIIEAENEARLPLILSGKKRKHKGRSWKL